MWHFLPVFNKKFAVFTTSNGKTLALCILKLTTNFSQYFCQQGSNKDNFARESVWSSDDETAEPLTKYRRLGIGSPKTLTQKEEQIVPTTSLTAFCGASSQTEVLDQIGGINPDLNCFPSQLDVGIVPDEDDTMGQSHDSDRVVKQNVSIVQN